MAAFIKQSSPLGYLTSRFWSPSALWTIDLVIVLTGLGFVTAAVNAAIRNVAVIRAFRTEFYEEFRLWRHLLIPGAAALLFLFPLWDLAAARLHADRGAAVHGTGMALRRRHRRRVPPNPAARRLQDAGRGVHAG
jgi:hypothetical protein